LPDNRFSQKSKHVASNQTDTVVVCPRVPPATTYALHSYMFRPIRWPSPQFTPQMMRI